MYICLSSLTVNTSTKYNHLNIKGNASTITQVEVGKKAGEFAYYLCRCCLHANTGQLNLHPGNNVVTCTYINTGLIDWLYAVFNTKPNIRMIGSYFFDSFFHF